MASVHTGAAGKPELSRSSCRSVSRAVRSGWKKQACSRSWGSSFVGSRVAMTGTLGSRRWRRPCLDSASAITPISVCRVRPKRESNGIPLQDRRRDLDKKASSVSSPHGFPPNVCRKLRKHCSIPLQHPSRRSGRYPRSACHEGVGMLESNVPLSSASKTIHFSTARIDTMKA